MNQEFDLWWYVQDFLENGDELQIDPREAASLAWAEAYQRATEEAAQICERDGFRSKMAQAIADLIRQSAEDV